MDAHVDEGPRGLIDLPIRLDGMAPALVNPWVARAPSPTAVLQAPTVQLFFVDDTMRAVYNFVR